MQRKFAGFCMVPTLPDVLGGVNAPYVLLCFAAEKDQTAGSVGQGLHSQAGARLTLRSDSCPAPVFLVSPLPFVWPSPFPHAAAVDQSSSELVKAECESLQL